jgi:hypothetical protein
MRRSAKMGDKNVSNRAYQMWKNYKKALKEGKHPSLPPLGE